MDKRRDWKLEADIRDPDTRDMIYFLEFMAKDKPKKRKKLKEWTKPA